MKRLKALLVAAMILQPFASVYAQEAVNPETPQVEQVAPASESPVSSTESSNPAPTETPTTPTAQPTTQGKELTDVVTDVDLLDGDNNIASPDAPYKTVESAYRKAKIQFDITPYKNTVKDGDYFTYTLPDKFDGRSTTIPLVEPESNITIGNVLVEGAKLIANLTGIDAYKAFKGVDGVKDLKGQFFFDWMVKSTYEGTATFDLAKFR